MNSEIAGVLETDETGWKRGSVWEINAATSGQWGDNAIGKGYEAYYCNGNNHCDTSYYVEQLEDGSFNVVECDFFYKTDGNGDTFDEHYEYDPQVHYNSFETLEAAENQAREFALVDERWLFLY
jgi:hypothetical protein